MKIFKSILVISVVAILTLAMFIPVFAVESVEDSDTDVENVDTGDILEENEETEVTTSVFKAVEVSPERVMDYTKMYHVATVTVKDCAKIKWYFLTEDGVVYNSGAVNEHHDSTYEIKWNSLDVNGKHPAGEWNKPVTVRFSLVIIATSITGVDEAYEVWFNYTWYDSENAATSVTTTTTTTTSSNTGSNVRSESVPHTGL